MKKSISILSKVTMIGAGGVANNILSILKASGCEILQVYSRTNTSAASLAEKTGAEPVTSFDKINRESDFYIYCLKDDVLKTLYEKHLPFDVGTHFHTSGSMSMDIFRKCGCKSYGVMYPFQTFTKGREICMSDVPVFIESNDVVTRAKIGCLADVLTENVYTMPTEKRENLHLVGVMMNNFVNALFGMSEELLNTTNLPKEVLVPILNETIRKALEIGPYDAQTGPARRGDYSVIRQHMALLENMPECREVYSVLTDYILKKYNKKQ